MSATWTSDRGRHAIELLRQGNPYFAVQNGKGEYRPQTGDVPVADVLAGTATVGFYAIRPDNLTRWGCLDFDDPPEGFTAQQWAAAAQSSFDALSVWFPETWLEESSPGRFHAFAFADKPIPATDMRAELRRIAQHATELFPKQDRLSPKPNAKGSLVRFPGFHQKKTAWSRILEIRGQTPARCIVAPVTEPAGLTGEGSVTGEPRHYVLRQPPPMPFIPESFASTARGQSGRKLFAMACALRNWERRMAETASHKMLRDAFWQWWNVSAANLDRAESNARYMARWERAYRNAKASTGALSSAQAAVSTLHLEGAAKLDALCRTLADSEGRFFLDCRSAGTFVGWSHMTALRWMTAHYEKVSSVSYTKRQSNRWRGHWTQ